MIDRNQQLLDDAINGKLTRRQMLARAGMLGLSVPALAGLLAACGGDDDDDDDDDAGTGDATTTGGGGQTGGGARATTAGGDASPTTSGGSNDATAATGTGAGTTGEASYEKIIIVQNADVRNFDPTIRPTSSDVQITNNIYDTLTELDEDFSLVPGLATAWELVDDTTWQFTLREGVEFHNGEPFNADTIVAWIERLQNVTDLLPEYNSSIQQIDSVEGTEKVDEHTVNFLTSRPDPVLPRNLSVYFTMIPPVTPFEEDGPEALFTTGIGTGPYKLVEWVKDDHLLIEANEDYWKGVPTIKQVEFRPVPEPSGRASALLAGEAQIADAVPIASLGQLEESDIAELRTVPLAAWIFWVQLNTIDVEPLKDVKVRQAMNHAVDKEAIIDAVLAGHAINSAEIVTKECFGFVDVPEYEYDPDKATQLLTEAGYPDGFTVKFYYAPGHYLADTEIVQAVANYLGEVGIQCEFQQNEWANHLTLVREQQIDGMHFSGKTILSIDSDYMFSELQPEKNFGWLFPLQGEAQEWYEQEQVEQDPEKRAELCAKIIQWYRDQAGILFLWQPEGLFGVAKDLVWTPPGDGYMRVYNMA